MGYLSKLRVPVEVALSGGYVAKVRALRPDERDQAREIAQGGKDGVAAAVKLRRIDPEADIPFDGDAFNRELLARCVCEWTLDDDDGKVLPITTETMQMLQTEGTAADYDRLLLAVNARTEIPAPKGQSISTVSA